MRVAFLRSQLSSTTKPRCKKFAGHAPSRPTDNDKPWLFICGKGFEKPPAGPKPETEENTESTLATREVAALGFEEENLG